MNTFVVTGNKGFIGKSLQKHLENLGNFVIGIDESYFDSITWEDDLLTLLNSSNCRGVFHVGACSDTLEQNVNYMMTRNYQSTKIIADWCYKHQLPLIYSSSAANYGINNSYPSNLYGWSKYVAEDYVVNKVGIGLRYFNVYGPGEENKGKMSSVAFQMFTKNKNQEDIKLFPKNPRRDFVYIMDVVSANIHAFENFENLKGKFYDVGSGISRPFEHILDLMNIEYSYVEESQIPIGYQYFTQSDTTKWLPGWSSKWSLEDGIKHYLSYLKD